MEFNKVEEIIEKFRNGDVNGEYLSQLVKNGEISKQERRKIQRKALKPPQQLTERQKLRQQVKEKKLLPKLTKFDRRSKFLGPLIEEREAKQAKFSICLGCRKKGHILKYCPDLSSQNGFCFNCGSHDHPLRACTIPWDPKHLPFAKCFNCAKQGHLSKDCPSNVNGLYPNGGCCYICSLKTHFAKDCPDRTEEKYDKKRETENEDSNGAAIGQVIDVAAGGDDDITPFLDNTSAEMDELDYSASNIERVRNKKRKKK